MAPRTCFMILLGQVNAERGYIPSVVVEGEAGHTPLIGKGECSEPWFWGRTYEQAKAVCAEANKKLGLSPGDVNDIIISSMAAENDAATRAAIRRVSFARAMGRRAEPADEELAARATQP